MFGWFKKKKRLEQKEVLGYDAFVVILRPERDKNGRFVKGHNAIPDRVNGRFVKKKGKKNGHK